MSRSARPHRRTWAIYPVLMAAFVFTAVGFAWYGHWYWLPPGIIGIVASALCWNVDERLNDDIALMRRLRKNDEYKIKDLQAELIRERQYRQAEQS